MPKASEVGVSFDHWCFACGRANPQSLKCDFDVSRDRVETRYVGRREHSGYDGTIHGGILATLLDEVMAWATFVREGTWGVTARLALEFRRPLLVGEEARVAAEVVRVRGRVVELRAEARRGDEVLVSAHATYVKMPEDRARELSERYGDPARIQELLVGPRLDATAYRSREVPGDLERRSRGPGLREGERSEPQWGGHSPGGGRT